MTPPLAGRWRRLFAGFIDGVIVAVISAPFVWTTYTTVWDSSKGMAERVEIKHVFIAGVISFLYYWLLHSYWNGQTLGKKLFGMRVVMTTGQPVTVLAAAIRQGTVVILNWLCCLGIVNLAWILFDPQKQALHDKAAKTLVVDA